jgi:uncharacterized protein YukJ
MPLPYGFLKGQIASDVWLKPSRGPSETQYHLHFSIKIGGQPWDVALNVGTDDDDDSLQYKLVFDFHHPITATLASSEAGQNDLTGQSALPALDFQRSDILTNTGDWRRSDPMDGSDAPEPVASVKRLLSQASSGGSTIYVFGRFYKGGDLGIHDIHMNQGSTGNHFRNPGGDPPHRSDGNDIWQDGGLIVDRAEQGFSAFFARFTQQVTPTDNLGNPAPR